MGGGVRRDIAPCLSPTVLPAYGQNARLKTHDCTPLWWVEGSGTGGAMSEQGLIFPGGSVNRWSVFIPQAEA